MRTFCEQMDKNARDGALTVASGYSVFDSEKDDHYRAVFERADKDMYQRKIQLKAFCGGLDCAKQDAEE